MNIQNIVDQYFDAFCKKDIETLSNLYHDEVLLNEWNSSIFNGKKSVLEANTQLFDQFKEIVIEVKTTGITENRSVNEIIVTLDDANVRVVDVIEIVDGKIKNITAYRGF